MIKYKDDGRDYVSIREFICIHMTFSVLHSWLTYFLIFNIFQSLWVIKTKFPSWWEKVEFLDLDTLAVISFVIMFVEMSIYLANFKDVIFATVTLLCYIGMFVYTDNSELNPHLIVFMSITGAFILITLIFDYDKAFYLKYRMFYIQYKNLKHKASKKSKKLEKKDLYGRGQTFADYVRFRGIALSEGDITEE